MPPSANTPSAALRARDRLAALDATGLVDGPVSPALDRLTRLAVRLLGVPAAVVTLVDDRRQFFAGQTGVAEPWASARGTPLSHSFCKHVVESGEPLIVEEAPDHPIVCDNLAIPDMGVMAYAGMPLRTASGHVLGSMCAIDEVARVWTKDELATLEDLAQAAVAELELATTARALSDVTTELRALLDDTTELVCSADNDGRITYANQAWLTGFGYTFEEAFGLRAIDLVAVEDRPRYIESARRLHAGEAVDAFEAVLLASDGRRLVCRGRARAEMVEDATAPNGRRCIGTRASYRDVTTERVAEVERSRLVALVESTTDFVCTSTRGGQVLYLNRAGRRLLGLADDTAIETLDARTFHPPETLETVMRDAMPAIARDGRWSGEGVLLGAGGERIPVSMSIIVQPSLLPGEPARYTSTLRDLRERVAAEEALRQREAQLRAVVDHAAMSIAVVAPDGTIESANPAFHTFLAAPPGTLVGRRTRDLSPPEEAAVTGAALAKLASGEASSVTVEKRFRRDDGAIRLADLTITQIPLADGRIGALGLAQDVTERRAAEAALAASEARYRAAIDGSLDAFLALRSIRDDAGAIVDFEIVEASERASALVSMPREDLVGHWVCELFPLTRTNGGFERFAQVVETRVTQEWETVPQDPRARAGALHIQAVPLDDGLALSMRDVTDRWRAEAERARLLAILDATPDAVMQRDTQGRVIYANAAARSMYAMEIGDRVASSGGEPRVYAPWAAQLVRDEALPTAMRDGVWQGETAVVSHDGVEIPVSQVILAHRDAAGAVTHVSSVMRDISDRKRSEEALERQRAFLAAVLEHLSDGVVACDADGQLTLFNRATREFHGLPARPLKPDAWAEHYALYRADGTTTLPVDEIPLVRAHRGERVHDEEMVIAPVDGDPRRVLASGQRFTDAAGEPLGAVVVMRDVTERARAEAALRESEERFRMLVSQVSDYAIYRLDADGRVQSWNAGAERLKGYSAQEIIGRHLSTFYPDDACIGGVPQSLLEVAKHFGRAEDEGWRVRKDGSQFWAHVTITAIQSPDGRVVGFAKVTRDLTEQREAERRLAESEARFRGVLETVRAVAVTLDGRGVITFANDALCTLTGWSASELVGRDWFTTLAPDGEATRRWFLDLAARGELPTHHENSLRTRSGEIKLIAWDNTVLRDASGAVVGTASIGHDVTEQRASEETLRAQALVDELTGVYNRRGFMGAAEREWQRAVRERHDVLLAYIDLNDFKGINDTHGHAEGDLALRMVGDVLRAAFRGFDVIGRLGGDEFAILVVPTGHPEMDTASMERVIRDRLSHHLEHANAIAREGGRPYDISLSVGIAGGPTLTTSLPELMGQADAHLYEQKRFRKARRAAGTPA